MMQHQYRAVIVQIVVGGAVALCAISSGLTLGFSAIATPQLRKSNGTDHMDVDEASWFASISSIVTPVGCLVTGPMLDGVGRKRTLLALNVPFVVGWVLLATAPSESSPLAQLYAGRAITGFATGMASVPPTVYLGEMAQASLRGMLVSWTSLAISIGILLVYVLGTVLQDAWRTTAAICAGLPVITSALVLLIVPESPAWLIGADRREEALVSLCRLRGVAVQDKVPPHVTQELDKMVANRSEAVGGLRTVVKLLRQPEAWKPMLIMNGFFFFQQVTGIYVVVYYAVDIVEEAGVTIDLYLATVLLGATQVVTGLGVAFALNRCGRRPLSLLSGVGQALCMLALGLYLQVSDRSETWIPLVAMLIYVVSGAIGFHTLPWAMLGEVFPSRVRGVAAGTTTCIAYVYSFVMLKVYPSMAESFQWGLFYFFGATSVLATIFVWLFLPETHRKTLQQIENEFKGEKDKPQNVPQTEL